MQCGYLCLISVVCAVFVVIFVMGADSVLNMGDDICIVSGGLFGGLL